MSREIFYGSQVYKILWRDICGRKAKTYVSAFLVFTCNVFAHSKQMKDDNIDRMKCQERAKDHEKTKKYLIRCFGLFKWSIYDWIVTDIP